MCYQGPDCPYLHRLPTSADNAAMVRTTGMDIFGREKLPDGLDNRKGAGSYERDMTTLYVHYGGAGHYAVPQLRHLLQEVSQTALACMILACQYHACDEEKEKGAHVGAKQRKVTCKEAEGVS